MFLISFNNVHGAPRPIGGIADAVSSMVKLGTDTVKLPINTLLDMPSHVIPIPFRIMESLTPNGDKNPPNAPDLTNIIGQGPGTIVEHAQTIPETIIAQAQKMPAAFMEQAQTIPATIIEQAQKLPAAFIEQAQTIPGTIIEQAKKIPATIMEHAQTIPATIVEQAQKMPAAMIDTVSTLPNTVLQTAGQIIPSDLPGTVAQHAAAIPSKVTEVAGQLIPSVGTPGVVKPDGIQAPNDVAAAGDTGKTILSDQANENEAKDVGNTIEKRVARNVEYPPAVWDNNEIHHLDMLDDFEFPYEFPISFDVTTPVAEVTNDNKSSDKDVTIEPVSNNITFNCFNRVFYGFIFFFPAPFVPILLSPVR